MTRLFSRALLLASLLAFSVSPALGQSVILMDYAGFGWEDGGIPHSDPGDILNITGTATDLDALFGVDLGVEEATVYIYDLVSTGEFVDPVSGFTFIGYTGGTIEVYKDTTPDHEWGIDPIVEGVATFTDGELLFEGAFTDFTLTLTSAGAGGYEGNIDGIGGTVAQLCDGLSDCAYTFGGAFTRDAGAQLPGGEDSGYHLQIDGTLEVDAAVSTVQSSFGAIKALYED